MNCKNLFGIIILIKLKFCSTMIPIHFKCRSELYPRSNIKRYPVPDDKVNWTVEFNEYKPTKHTAKSVYGKPWADLEIDDPNFKPKWNSLDGNISRISYMGLYKIENGFPLNIMGRTGICGRGVLGRWGPNHAADPIVTRWKRTDSGEIKLDENKLPILQFVAVKRGDTGEWACPGGMVDPGEKVAQTAMREFMEEATNSLTMSNSDCKEWKQKFENFFSVGEEVYKGYVDDPRNTDNSWMETVAYNFHDESGNVVGGISLQAGDDATGVQWVDITHDITLYASHSDLVMKVLKKRLSAIKM